jgi:hypothetical protein
LYGLKAEYCAIQIPCEPVPFDSPSHGEIHVICDGLALLRNFAGAIVGNPPCCDYNPHTISRTSSSPADLPHPKFS